MVTLIPMYSNIMCLVSAQSDGYESSHVSQLCFGFPHCTTHISHLSVILLQSASVKVLNDDPQLFEQV
jgi:hypothetical protein